MSNDFEKKAKKDKKEKKDKKIKKEKKEKKEKRRESKEQAVASDVQAATTSRMRTRSFDAAEKQDSSNKNQQESSSTVKPQKRGREEDREATPKRMRTRSMDKQEESASAAQSKTNSQLSDFRISSTTVAALQKRNITSLFPIQALTFDSIFDGRDLIGRARTGMGKTLAFALPIIERLLLAGKPLWVCCVRKADILIRCL